MAARTIWLLSSSADNKAALLAQAGLVDKLVRSRHCLRPSILTGSRRRRPTNGSDAPFSIAPLRLCACVSVHVTG